MTFYERYKELCRRKGKSPSAVALELGISKSAVSTWKNIGRTPKSGQLQMIADYFGVSMDYLIGAVEEPYIDIRAGPKYNFIKTECLKYAIFGTDKATDEQLDEVRLYAKFIMQRDRTK